MLGLKVLVPLWLVAAQTVDAQQSPEGQKVVRIGRVGPLETQEAERLSAPFLRYLENRLPGHKFAVRVFRTDEEAVASVAQAAVDFLFVTPSAFVRMEVQHQATPIATARIRYLLSGPHHFVGGAVICRSDRHELQRLADLRGRRVMGFNPGALGGWISTLRELKAEGIDPQRDFSRLEFGSSQEAVARAVRDGAADAGVLPINALGRMYTGKLFRPEEFRVLPPRDGYPRHDGTEVAASTRLYPGTPFVRLRHVPDALAEKVAAALFEMPEDSEAAKSMHVSSWTLPANYQPVHECLKELGIKPYENFGKVSFWGAVGQHWEKVVLSLLAVIAALAGAAIHVLWLNRRLRASQAALAFEAQLLAQTSDAVVATDENYRITFWNVAAERLYGWKSEEVLGVPIEEVVPSLSGSRTREEIRSTLREQGHWSGRMSFSNRAGDKVHVEVAIRRLQDAEGRAAGTVAGIRDVTDKKRLEEQVLQLQRMEAVGLLAGGIAHDFNNLLTVINGYTQLALKRSESGGAVGSQLSEVMKAGTRAADLTRQLLAFSRKQVLQPQVVDLNRLVEDAEGMLQRLIGEEIRVTSKPGARPSQIMADPGQVQQVLVNLVVNARDAMPGGGELLIETANTELDDAYCRAHADVVPGRYVTVSVSDTGHGMDEFTRQHIFEPFFTTKEQGKGTGLGLSTVFGIVKQSGGHITVYSEPGRGTTIKVYLPGTGEDEEPVPCSAGAGDLRGAETLLVVEDQDEVRNFACEVLRSFGYTVLEAAGGEEAVRRCQSAANAVRLLVTDVVMPGMTGPELAGRLRELSPSLKVLYMSGYTDNVIVHRGVLDDAVPFLQKPFSPEALAGKVREVLSGPG